jgi:2'-5' RNA ligase
MRVGTGRGQPVRTGSGSRALCGFRETARTSVIAQRPSPCTSCAGSCKGRLTPRSPSSEPASARLQADVSVRPGGGERIRLFVALELPDSVRPVLEGWRAEVVRAGSEADPRTREGRRPGVGAGPGLDAGALRAVAPEALHVTLCFLGWRGGVEVEEIGAACASCLQGVAAPALALGAGIWLPPRRPRVLAVALEDDGGALARAQALLSRRLHEGSWYAPEARPFLPHVTVARVRGGAGVRPLEPPAVPELAFKGTSVTLYRSRLYSAGVRYEPLRTVALS